MANKKKSKNRIKIKRPSYPDDEKLHSWLPVLLEAYHIVDKGITGAIASEEKKGRKLACRKQCTSCCRTQEGLPVYPLELVGMSWFSVEKISGAVRETLREQLVSFDTKGQCPFLIKGECVVYSMRPLGCRQFNVFGSPCAEDEDPYYSRRDDVLNPVKKHVDQAFYIMLPFYGISNESERKRVIENGEIHEMVKAMNECNWKSLAEKMDEFDKKADDSPSS